MQETVLRLIRLRARRRTLWLRRSWTAAGQQVSEAEFSAGHAEVDVYLTDVDSPDAEMEWCMSDPILKMINDEIAEIEHQLENDKDSPLGKLKIALSLQASEVHVIQVCLALVLEPNLSRVYGYLQDHNGRGYVTIELVARLFGYGRSWVIGSSSALVRWRLIVKENMRMESDRISLDPFVRDWLLGSHDSDPLLNEYSEPIPLSVDIVSESWPVMESLQYIKNAIADPQSKPLRISIAGSSGSGRIQFAALLRRDLDMPLFIIDSDRISENEWPDVFMAAQRYAHLSDSVIVWTGMSITDRNWSDRLAYCKLEFVVSDTGRSLTPSEKVKDKTITLPDLSFEESRQLWKKFVPSAIEWNEEELDELLRRHRVNVEHIVEAKASKPADLDEAEELMRSMSRNRLNNLAQPIESGFKLDDLVVGKNVRQKLERFSFEADFRRIFWELPGPRRLFPQGRGLMGLFTGQPGTGKTMAAQAIANELRLPIYRIDLSAVVSRYVGDTSKNLASILSNARQMNVLLFFDEADAIFSKRISETKDAQDHFINSDLSFLLTAIENYSGISLLATNKKANMDAAFIRRLRFVVDFAKPDLAQRVELWSRILPELAGDHNISGDDLETLAEAIELTGAQIKYSALSAIFIAQKAGEKLSISHLLEGIDGELQKEGRGLSKHAKGTFKQNA